MNEIRVMIIDEHLAVRRALAARLAAFPNIDVVATARDCREGLERALDNRPDVVLMELKGKNSYQPEAIREMNNALPEHHVGIIVLTSYADDEEQQAALKAGAKRYLLKHIDTAKLTDEIEAVAAEALGTRPS
jgi:NarL family two-component system response regulator LiaR